MIPLRFIAVLFAVALLGGSGRAASPDEPVKVTLRFLFLDESAGSYSIRIDGRYDELGPTPYVISAPEKLAPAARMELFKEKPDPKTGVLVKTRVLNRQVPSGLISALVVVTPTSTTSEDGTWSYGARFYDTDPAKTPPRSIRIFNLSPVAMVARFGADQVGVGPGESTVTVPPLDPRGRARTFVGVRAAGEGKLIYNSFISLREGQRMTGIVVYSPSGMRHTYTEDELKYLGAPKPGCFWLMYSETE